MNDIVRPKRYRVTSVAMIKSSSNILRLFFFWESYVNDWKLHPIWPKLMALNAKGNTMCILIIPLFVAKIFWHRKLDSVLYFRISPSCYFVDNVYSLSHEIATTVSFFRKELCLSVITMQEIVTRVVLIHYTGSWFYRKYETFLTCGMRNGQHLTNGSNRVAHCTYLKRVLYDIHDYLQ